ncbi:MAG TPA: DUF1850 domain-containing protein [Usitatibacter sp.]|nr:DUF1850 domain-containing protein [Usitatibacter sp.]
MGAVCIAMLAGAMLHVFPASRATLRWTHSVEHVPWEEDYVATSAGLRLVEARVHASGAGMDAPADARWNGSAWSYRPGLPPLAEVALANSAFVEGYRLCLPDGGCFALAPRGTAVRLLVRECPAGLPAR